jgi:hypothetical protein
MADTLNSSVLRDGIRSLILFACRSAARGVNLLQVYTSYEIGGRIVEQEQRGADRAEYGKQALKELLVAKGSRTLPAWASSYSAIVGAVSEDRRK